MSRFLSHLMIAASLSAAFCGCAQTQGNRVTVTANKPAGKDSVSTRDRSHEGSRSRELPDSDATESDMQLVSGDDEIEQDQTTLESIISDPLPEAAPQHVNAVVLTLADLEAMALEFNPTLSQASAAVDQERGTYRQAGLYPNPQLGYLNTTANQSDPRQANGVLVSQEIVTAKKLSLAQQSSMEAI